jgi:hypothetical protein
MDLDAHRTGRAGLTRQIDGCSGPTAFGVDQRLHDRPILDDDFEQKITPFVRGDVDAQARSPGGGDFEIGGEHGRRCAVDRVEHQDVLALLVKLEQARLQVMSARRDPPRGVPEPDFIRRDRDRQQRRLVGPLLQFARRLRPLARDQVVGGGDPPAGAADDPFGHPLAGGYQRRKRVLGVGEVPVRDVRDAAGQLGAQGVVAAHAPQHTERVRGIAVGVLATARGDLHAPERVPPAVKQPHGDVRAVELRVDVERITRQAIDVVLPFRLDLAPGGQPVFGVLPVPAQDIRDALMVLRSGRDAGQPLPQDALDVAVLEIGGGVHSGDKHAAVHPVAVVHDVAEDVAQPIGLARQAGTDDTEQVGLDLEINVVGVAVVPRVSRPGGHDSAADVRAPRAVGVPELVLGARERRAGLLRAEIEPVGLQSLQERHLDVAVVLVNRVGHALRAPDFKRVGNRSAGRFEFVGRSVTHADHLTRPGALALVDERGLGQTPDLASGRGNDEERAKQQNPGTPQTDLHGRTLRERLEDRTGVALYSGFRDSPGGCHWWLVHQ